MRNLLYFALCITLCAAIGCDEPEQKPATPDTPTAPAEPTTPTEPDEPTLPPSVPSDGTERTVSFNSTYIEWHVITIGKSDPSIGNVNDLVNSGNAVTLLGIKATAEGLKTSEGGTSSIIHDTILEEVKVGNNTDLIFFGEEGYASSGFAKSVRGVVIQELLLSEGLAVVDDATSNTSADQKDPTKISYATYTKWKALEVPTPPAGNGDGSLNN